MKGRTKCSFSQNKRIITVISVFVLVFCVGAAGYLLTDKKIQNAQETSSSRQRKLNPGCESMEENPLRLEEDPDIIGVIEEYYQELADETSFIEGYHNLRVYTKLGKYEDTCVAFVSYGMKIKDVYTEVPGLVTLYLYQDESGAWKVEPEAESEELQTYIDTIAAHEDVQTLLDQTQTAYQEAVQSDALLEEALTDLKNAYEDSTGS